MVDRMREETYDGFGFHFYLTRVVTLDTNLRFFVVIRKRIKYYFVVF